MNEIKYTWVSLCHDNTKSFLDDKNPTYETLRDCYNAMRSAVFSKMTWNTDYDEDFTDKECPVVYYEVHFKKDMIVHRSYSGDYIYLIVRADDIPSPEYVYGRLAEFLGVKAYGHHYGI